MKSNNIKSIDHLNIKLSNGACLTSNKYSYVIYRNNSSLGNSYYNTFNKCYKEIMRQNKSNKLSLSDDTINLLNSLNKEYLERENKANNIIKEFSDKYIKDKKIILNNQLLK